MDKRKIWIKRVVAAACCAAMAVTMLPAGIVLQTEASPEVLLNDNAKNIIRPLVPTFETEQLLAFKTGAYADDPYVKSTVPLKKGRYQAPFVNDWANDKAKVATLTINSKMDDVANAYAFTHWQYIDVSGFWGPSDGWGFVKPPVPDFVDAAHKNGVPALGQVFVVSPYELAVKMLQKDEKGRFPFADKLVELQTYYGFDGWFFNFEHTLDGDKQSANRVKEFLAYLQQIKPEGGHIQWYDGLTNDGSLSYQNMLNDRNSDYFQWGDKRTSDSVFANYWWSASAGQVSNDTATKLGRDPFDVYQALELQRGAAYNDTTFPSKDTAFFPKREAKASLGLFVPSSTLTMSGSPEEFLVHENRLWTGFTGDPSKPDMDARWKGFSTFINARTVIDTETFTTHFSTGQGYGYYVDGINRKDGEWANFGMQDIMPTWRWIVDTESSKKLVPEITFDDAYYGGSSLGITGGTEAGKPVTMRLYSTYMPANGRQELSVTYKTPLDAAGLQVGLKIAGTNDRDFNEEYTWFDVPAGTPGEWNTATFDLSEYEGRYIREIGLQVTTETDVDGYALHIGEIAIEDTEQAAYQGAVSNVVLDETSFPSPVTAQAKFRWDAPENKPAFYEIRKENSDGSRSVIGATVNNAYYASKIDRGDDGAYSKLEILPVGDDYSYGTPVQFDIRWGIDADSAEIDTEEVPVNLALNNPNVRASRQLDTEPAKNAVDGVIVNGSKWCCNGTSNWLEVSYDEPVTVQRWRVVHAGHPEAGEGASYNTKNFSLQVSDDGTSFRDVSIVQNNSHYETDINLEEPVTGKYFRLNITKPTQSSDTWCRIYEFQLFEKTYTYRTDAIEPENVVATNAAGDDDTVTIGGLSAGEVVKLYKSLYDSEAYVSQTVPEGATQITFEGLAFAKESAKIFFTRTAPAKRESLRASVRYLAEDAQVTAVPAAADIAVANNNGNVDTVTVSGLREGDVVRLYENADAALPYAQSKPVKAGENAALVDDLTLQKAGGTLYISVESLSMKPSEKCGVPYGAEAIPDAYLQDFEGEDTGRWLNSIGLSDLSVADGIAGKSLCYTSFGNFDRDNNDAVVYDSAAPVRYDAILNFDVLLEQGEGTADGNFSALVKFKDYRNYVEIQAKENGDWTWTLLQDKKAAQTGTFASDARLTQGEAHQIKVLYRDDDYVVVLDDKIIGDFSIEGTAEMCGRFGFRTIGTSRDKTNRNRGVQIDNVRFSAYSEQPEITGMPESGSTRYAVTLQANKEVTFVVNGVEAGKAGTTLRLNDEGEYAVYAMDVDGGRSLTVHFSIDRTKPVMDATAEHYGRTNQDVVFTTNEPVQFFVNGEAATDEYATSFTLTESGDYRVRGIDRAGNYCDIHRVIIDKEKPVLTGVPDGGFVRGNAATVQSDKKVFFSVNGVAQETMGYYVRVYGDGTYVIQATDAVGNESVLTLTIDNEKPVLSSEDVQPGGATKDAVTIRSTEPVRLEINGALYEKPNPESGNLSVGKASASSTGMAKSATDGDASTFILLYAKYDSWITVDMGESTTVDRWVVKNYSGPIPNPETYWARDFKLQVSDDNQNWTDVDSVFGNQDKVSDRMLQQAVTARYFRLYLEDGTQDTAALYPMLAEFELYAPADTSAYLDEMTFDEPGDYVVKAWDRAGNYGGFYRFTIDRTAPSLTAVIEGTNKAVENGATVRQNVTVKASEASYFIVDGGEPTERANFVKLKAAGAHTVQVMDALGNLSETFTVTIEK